MLACCVLVVLTGCGRSIRAVDVGDQIVSNRHRTATVNTPQFEISATWAPVPWASRNGPLAFLLQIANLSTCAVEFNLDGLKLEDGFGRFHGVVSPEKLSRAFSVSSSAPPARRATLVSHRRHVRHYRHYHRHRPYYRRRYYYRYRPYYWGYAGYGAGGWIGGGYDPYYDQRKTARFLAELLESQTIPPQGVATGYAVFPYEPVEGDERLTLWVEIGPPEGAAVGPSADSTPVSMLFEVK